MAKTGFTRSESFLQWIWQNLLFDLRALETTAGKKIRILDPGFLNSSDGADFKNASIEVDGLRWFGDVEIHTKASHWNAHHHQTNPRYNSVILHVVADNEAELVFTENHASPFTLNLYPYLTKRLPHFLRQFEDPESLACASTRSFISENAFYDQIQKAHEEYLEKKTDDILKFYLPDLPPSQAWKQAFIKSLWDGSGIPHNRLPMQQVSEQLLKLWDGQKLESGKEIAFRIAGFSSPGNSLNWNHKGVRPAHHPKARIPEAVALTYYILQTPFDDFLSLDLNYNWANWLAQSALKNSTHFQILFGTVYLPALYVLGKLFAHHNLCTAVRTQWNALKTPIPASLLLKYNSLHLKDDRFRKKLGAIHQLRSYCEAGRCSECFVLKNAIQS